MYIKHLSCKYSVNNPPVSRVWRHAYSETTVLRSGFDLESTVVVHVNLENGVADTRERSQAIFFHFSISKSINATYLINEASYQNILCVRNFPRAKSKFVPKGIPIGLEMAEKMCKNIQTDKQTDIFVIT